MNNPVKTYALLFMAMLSMSLIHGQDIYIPIDGAVYRIDLNNCEKELVVDLKGKREENPVISSCVFHPDGGLYIFSEKNIYIYGVLKNALINRINSGRNFTISPHNAVPPYYSTIEEKGYIYFSSGNQDKIFYFNIINPTRPNSINVHDFKDLYDRYIGGTLDSKYLSSEPGEINRYHLWNPTGDDKAFSFSSKSQYQLARPIVYYPSCGSPKVISIGRNTEDNTFHLLMVDHESQDVTELCENLNFDQSFSVQMGNPTGFRPSPIRLDLDADNSSRHITGGYYDTLSTCSSNVRINDDDIDINTCGKTIDSISFSLAYLEDEPITNENIFIKDGIKRTPSRWVWKNHFGQDLNKIKDHLRSVKYAVENEKEYDHTYSFERAVITTLYAEGDSTSSWAVIRLLDDAVNAGQDTTVLYCPDTKQINLKEYVGRDALTDGNFEQNFSGGDGIFQPGIDEDGEYLYIAGNGECYDTAIFTVEEISPSATGLDTIQLCSGEQTKVGFPAEKYNEIRWWDDTTGDSIVIMEAADVTRYVELTYKDCRIKLPVVIEVENPQDIAGRDTTITYCPAGKVIDLNNFLISPNGSLASIRPEFQHGEFIYTPGIDSSGIYQYVVQAGECKDTAFITMVESAAQELPFGPIYRCSDQDVGVNLPPGEYENIKWWNGDADDSTWLTGRDFGPFFVEAQKDGCHYRSDFEVITKDAGGFPGTYPDSLVLCSGEPIMITVQDLDSIIANGITYTMGDQITFSEAGYYALTGFTAGCAVRKDISVKNIADPSDVYDRSIYWCEDTPLFITLPNDSAGWNFTWPDSGGSLMRELEINRAGEYTFEIHSDNCTFQSSYTIIKEQESDCIRKECTIVIPNAISPNGDRLNDELNIISSLECGMVEMVRLWNKWGGLLYQSRSSRIETDIWNDVLPGTYMVQVDYKDESGNPRTKTGSVLVVK